MTPECTETLVERLDEAAAQFEFPGWECGDQQAVVGAMRASGFDLEDGAALVFEDFEYSLDERVVQPLAFCVATEPLSNWVVAGDGAYLDVSSFASGDAAPDTASVELTSRGESFTVDFDREALVSSGVLDGVDGPLTPEAVLMSTCRQVPRDWLFSAPAHLVESFDLGPDASRRFAVESWEHPSFEALYAEERPPSSFPDIVALAEASCAGVDDPDLPGTPNTSWAEQCE